MSSQAQRLAVVGLVWAAIYLPALGSFEIKGEEGRRILAAMAMQESGNYLVPEVGGNVYLRKPPLVNWLIAGSFKLFGRRNEWTARAPSVAFVLAVALAFVTVARRSLGEKGSLMAALIWLTNFGLLGKGRLIEIEAVYVSLCGLAIICWLAWWQERRSPWLTWTVPWIFLGLGWLAKGPVHLVFFYAVVLAVLWQTKQWRMLFHPAHFAGIVLMLGIFGAWAIPFLEMAHGGDVMQKWSSQFTGRVTGQSFKFRDWILTIPRALGYFLPWLLLVPFLDFGRFPENPGRKMARGLAWSVGVPLVATNLLPGAAPRYSLPAIVPFCWLIGMAFEQGAFWRPRWIKETGKPFWLRVAAAFVGLTILAGLIGFPVAAKFVSHRQKVKSVANQFNAVVPQSEILYAVSPSYQPFLFYMRAPVKYVSSVGELPGGTRYFLVQPEHEREALASEQWAPRRAREVLRITDYRKQTVILFAVDAL